jgi:abortive infection bacteriophage resistance protein
MRFEKPALSFPQQLAKLRARGLVVPDTAAAEHCLRYVGYYRLSAYALTFQDRAQPGKPFRPGTTFDQLVDLYRFDRELRLLVLDAIERVEVAVRSALNNQLCLCHGPHWFTDATHFHAEFGHPDFLTELREEYRLAEDGSGPIRPHQEVFISHYYEKYGDPQLPPSWMVFETFTINTVSRMYRNLTSRQLRQEIAATFGADESNLRGWLHTLSYVRNLCAHHARLWNRRLVIKFTVANKHRTVLDRGDTLYATAVVLRSLLRRIAPDSQWHWRLRELIGRYPTLPLGAMGFPSDWQRNSFWDFPHSP